MLQSIFYNLTINQLLRAIDLTRKNKLPGNLVIEENGEKERCFSKLRSLEKEEIN